MLHINELTYHIAGRDLLDRATVHIPTGHRVGLVGRNGTGKSTLLRLVLGEIQPDDGSLRLRAGARIGVVPQEAPGGPEPVIEAVLAADIERTRLLDEADHATDPHRIAEIHTRLADIEAHSAPARAGKILAGLGFDDAAQLRPCASFSGGWRTRIALAATLFSEPDLLLLDEPSNYLDLEATLWLENFLKTYPRTLLMVSHDRELLNEVATTIVHLDQRKLTRYRGNYDAFEKLRREKLTLQAAESAKQQAQRQRMQAFVDRFRAKASKARQAQSRLKMLARMDPVVPIVEDQVVTFNFPQPDPLSPPLVSLEDCAVGYTAERPVLTHLDLRIDMDDRIALLGANGNGKSTFAKLLAGRLKPMAGKLRKSSKLKVGYFAQHQLDELIPSETAFDHMKRRMEDAPDARVRAALGQFGFAQAKADIKVGALSGGEKARLLLALTAHDAPHLLIMDEPTNHLDIDSREALIAALTGYDGALITISHDPHFLSLVADRLWLVDGGCVASYDGDLEDYRTFVLNRSRGGGGATAEGPAAEADDAGARNASGRDARRARADQRAALAPLKQAVRKAESEIARLTKEKTRLESLLARPDIYDGKPDDLIAINREHASVLRLLDAAETRWMEDLERYETAQES